VSAPLGHGASDGPVAVIGIGNVLLRDDGVGVHVVRAMRRLAERGEIALAAETRLVDGGTLSLDLLPEIAGARAVVFVDAADLGRAPGAVAPIRGTELRRSAAGAGHLHGGLAGLLATAELAGALPQDVALVGIQPHTINVGLEPTAAVRAAVPAAVATTLAELDRLAATTPRRGPAPGDQEITGAPA
jgi:hydrogenase maturation protease